MNVCKCSFTRNSYQYSKLCTIPKYFRFQWLYCFELSDQLGLNFGGIVHGCSPFRIVPSNADSIHGKTGIPVDNSCQKLYSSRTWNIWDKFLNIQKRVGGVAYIKQVLSVDCKITKTTVLQHEQSVEKNNLQLTSYFILHARLQYKCMFINILQSFKALG